MSVPLLDVNAQNHPLEAAFTEAFLRVFKSGQFILGPEITRLEEAICHLTQTRHAIGVSSGTDALLLALMALGIGAGDEVLVPSFTFFATAGCVSRTGATPVFVDSCPVCFNIDLDGARRKITSRTKAVMPVHLFGQCAGMDGVMAMAREHGLKVIEDAAQSIGATYRGNQSGSMGDFGAYSFFPSKNLGGFGDGGALVCQDDELAGRARMLRTHGSKPKYYHHYVGGNFRLDPLQAAMLMVKLPHYPRYTAGRRANAAYYTERLLEAPGVEQADPANCACHGAGQPGKTSTPQSDARIVLPVACPGNGHIWNQYTLRVRGSGRRDALRDHLAARKIGCEIYYPVTMDQQKCFADTPPASRVGCDVAHELASEVLSIPIYPELTVAQKDEVIHAIAEFAET